MGQVWLIFGAGSLRLKRNCGEYNGKTGQSCTHDDQAFRFSVPKLIGNERSIDRDRPTGTGGLEIGTAFSAAPWLGPVQRGVFYPEVENQPPNRCPVLSQKRTELQRFHNSKRVCA
jgi:hypothetical protein